MKLTSLDILQFLSNNGGLNNVISISELVDKEFPNGMSFDESLYKLRPIYRLLSSLETEKFIKNLDTPSPNGNSYTWDVKKNIQMELTIQGESYLRDNIQKEREYSVSTSEIEFNRRMLDVAIDQAASSSIVAANTKLQTDFMKKQTNALLVTAVFALGSIIISYKSCEIAKATYERDNSKSQLEQSVRKLQKDTSKLYKRLIQIKIDSSRLSEEVKTLTKKK